MRRLALLACLLAGPAWADSPPGTWQPRTSADLMVLDKVRAQPTAVTIRTGQAATFGTLSITLRNCVARPPDLPADSAAFLDVVDSRDNRQVFHGWMLANAPSLTVVEHPLYDIRLVACR